MNLEPALLQITANGVQRTYPLSASRYRMGRSARAEILLKDPLVSRMQAILLHRPKGQYLLVDGNGKRGSCNGTYVNGVRVKFRLLEDQDVLFLGSPGVMAQIFLPNAVSDGDQGLPEMEQCLPDEVPTEIGAGLMPPSRALLSFL